MASDDDFLENVPRIFSRYFQCRFWLNSVYGLYFGKLMFWVIVLLWEVDVVICEKDILVFLNKHCEPTRLPVWNVMIFGFIKSSKNAMIATWDFMRNENDNFTFITCFYEKSCQTLRKGFENHFEPRKRFYVGKCDMIMR
jgi:hypothetical protein